MKKEELIQVLSEQFKLVRAEFGYHQEEMAAILGLSKKTLIQIEKGRQLANWIQVIALCSIFQDSTVLRNVLGSNPLEMIQTIARQDYYWHRPKTLGGKVWWLEKARGNGFVLQQNIISKHYRILDDKHRRWFSSFDKDASLKQFQKLTGGDPR